MIRNEREIRREQVLQAAYQMMTAARTARSASACATAADQRVDTRVMFSVGLAAQRLQLLGDCKCVMAIPVSASSKNPFFDRKPKTES